jgi:hypothetical protein
MPQLISRPNSYNVIIVGSGAGMAGYVLSKTGAMALA